MRALVLKQNLDDKMELPFDFLWKQIRAAFLLNAWKEMSWPVDWNIYCQDLLMPRWEWRSRSSPSQVGYTTGTRPRTCHLRDDDPCDCCPRYRQEYQVVTLPCVLVSTRVTPWWRYSSVFPELLIILVFAGVTRLSSQYPRTGINQFFPARPRAGNYNLSFSFPVK